MVTQIDSTTLHQWTSTRLGNTWNVWVIIAIVYRALISDPLMEVTLLVGLPIRMTYICKPHVEEHRSCNMQVYSKCLSRCLYSRRATLSTKSYGVFASIIAISLLLMHFGQLKAGYNTIAQAMFAVFFEQICSINGCPLGSRSGPWDMRIRAIVSKAFWQGSLMLGIDQSSMQLEIPAIGHKPQAQHLYQDRISICRKAVLP